MGCARQISIKSFDDVVFALWLKLITTSPGLQLVCSQIMLFLLLMQEIREESSWRTPWKQLRILLCSFVLLIFLQLNIWSPYGSSFWPHRPFLFIVICGSGNCILLRIVVLNSKGDNLKMYLCQYGVISPFDKLVFSIGALMKDFMRPNSLDARFKEAMERACGGSSSVYIRFVRNVVVTCCRFFVDCEHRSN